MSPLILKGDVIIVKPYNYAKINLGDTILFKMAKIAKINKEGKNKKVCYVVHRVIGRRTIAGRKYLVQKGDASIFGCLIEHERVAGKVVAIERGDYSIDLNKIEWKVLNTIFTIFAVFEYGLSEVLAPILKFLPKKARYYSMRKFMQIGSRLKAKIYRTFLALIDEVC